LARPLDRHPIFGVGNGPRADSNRPRGDLRRALPDLEERRRLRLAQFPFRIGLLGVQTLWKVVNGQKVPANVDTGTALVTKANATKFGG